MRCPYCGHLEDKVVDSRESRERDAIRRRRECLACNRRFTSYERVEEIPILLVKKDGRREAFEREKLLKGMLAACQKRPVSVAKLEAIVSDIQAQLLEYPEREISSRALGDMVMDALKQLDSVAYVRFASIYRDFKDLPDFVAALETLMANPANRPISLAPAPTVPMPLATDSHPTAPDEPAMAVSPSREPAPERDVTPLSPLSTPPTPLFPDVEPATPATGKRRKSR